MKVSVAVVFEFDVTQDHISMDDAKNIVVSMVQQAVDAGGLGDLHSLRENVDDTTSELEVIWTDSYISTVAVEEEV